jgi:hypothetical protein
MGLIGDKKMTDTKTTEVKQRNKRKPFGVPRSKLTIAKQDPAFHYRWILDAPGRLQEAIEGDYTFVTPEEVGREDTKENKVYVRGGSNVDGSEQRQYLMKIPREFHEEDSKVSQAYLDEIDAAIKGGKVNQTLGDNRYVPENGISIKRK